MYTANDVEVFVLTHKRPVFLKETLDGYLQQTVKGFRLAVFSNGHSPETKRLLEDYAHYGVEDFYVDEELTGVQNHARALAHASRKILIVAHDDDFIHPTYIAHLLDLYNSFPRLSLILSGQSGESFSWNKPPLRKFYHLKNQNEFAAYIYSGGGFAFSSACYKTEFVKRVNPNQGKPFGKVDDVPFLVTACGNGEAAVTCFPFIKARIHDGQDTFNYTTGPSAKEWFNLSLFYKNLLENPKYPRLRWVFLLQNYRHIRIGWKDWCKCEYSHMNFGQFCQEALVCGALTKRAIWCGRLLRGKLSHYLQQKIVGFEIKNF